MTSNTNKSRLKALAYSIRKRDDDEIEIRDSIYDGYIRGFLRLFILLGIIIIGSSRGSSIISDLERDYYWVFDEDKIITKSYNSYKKREIETAKILNQELDIYSYEEYKQSIYYPDNPVRDLILDVIWIPFVVFAFFSPRPRGIRINRKKRLIYWQTIFTSHSIAYVPDSGDPLGGLNYSRFGLYAFGEHERFSLQFWIDDYLSKRRTTAWFGVYPSPSAEHNGDIIRAMRAYLTEENPEFLNYIGNDFKNFGANLLITFSNAFALRVPFNRKKADNALEEALAIWSKKTDNQKQGWFNDMRGKQKIINENHKREELDNVVE
ncbi:hypothetical protein [Exercitatus varius]|uniref:hypothetical protein n=1 Tax=Exercitatus varius TaxID=67857 RepID=UPI00294B984A|nr:hypothetical protein [Exercitatus varius]MDG2942785.1 hypothetical protein [Exercitatus varius]